MAQHSQKQKNLTMHQQTVRNILGIMAKNEPITIWDMAKIKFANDTSKLRYKREKIQKNFSWKRG